MLEELGQALYSAKLQWKESSLDVVAYGSSLPGDVEDELQVFGQMLAYKKVDRLEVLGCALDSRGCSHESWERRCQKAEGKFYANPGLLNSWGGLEYRLRAWTGGPMRAAIFESESWHLTGGLLHSARVWEMKKLRSMLRMKPSAQQTRSRHGSRLSDCSSYRSR